MKTLYVQKLYPFRNYTRSETIPVQKQTRSETIPVQKQSTESVKKKTSIKRVFSFEKIADECTMINEKPIFFAFVKEYYFAGGWAKPTNLTIFDLNGNKVGIAPDWEYAEQFCDFY